MGHVHTKSNSYALTRVTDQIIFMSLSGVCLECRKRIQPIDYTSSIQLPFKTFQTEFIVLLLTWKQKKAI